MPGAGVCTVWMDRKPAHTPVPKGWWRCASRRSSRSRRVAGRRERDADGQPRALRAGPCPPYLLHVFPQMREIRSKPLTNCGDRLSISRASGGGRAQSWLCLGFLGGVGLCHSRKPPRRPIPCRPGRGPSQRCVDGDLCPPNPIAVAPHGPPSSAGSGCPGL